MRWWVVLVFLVAQVSAQEGIEEALEVAEEAIVDGPEEEEVEEFVPLQPWTEEDLALLESGDLVAGHFLLGLPKTAPRNYFPELPEAPPELPDPGKYQDENEVDRSWISAEMLGKYFSDKPERELVDPQQLLSQQAFQDRAAFLEYHRKDSDIPIYIYLFDGSQEVPYGYDVEAQLERQLSEHEPVCLAYYFLGKPEKSELAMSPGLRGSLTLLEYRRVLDSAIAEATEKSETVDQLEGFAVQLSIRMYWLERAMREKAGVGETLRPAPDLPPPPKDHKTSWQKVEPFLGHATLVLFGLLVVTSGWIGRKIALSRRRYVFPDSELPVRLEAPHAAGVGAVIRFHSTKVPPAAQREQVPDYLTRS